MERFVFEIGGEAFSIETRFVHRVLDEARITAVPLMPACYLGLTYYRGELFDVIHLATLLGAASSTDEGRLILIRWEGRNLGLMVDRVKGLSWVEDAGGGPRLITPEELWEKMNAECGARNAERKTRDEGR